MEVNPILDRNFKNHKSQFGVLSSEYLKFIFKSSTFFLVCS
jgi:hypothetical protein